MEDTYFNELTRKISQYFDHQLKPEDEKAFLMEIKKNPAGHSAFMKEKQIREKLKANVHRSTHTHNLEAQIRDKIKRYPT